MPESSSVFFLHIPKTAGSSFNDAFKTFSADEKYFIHLESNQPLFRGLESERSPFFASGHIPFVKCAGLIRRQDVYAITIARDPLEQLLSHLKWVKALGNPDQPHLARAIPQSIADLARDMFAVSLSDVDAMRRIIARPAGMQLFDNVHTRYLSAAHVEKVGEDQLAESLKNVDAFDLVFALEDYDDGLSYLRRKFPSISNRHQNARLNRARLSELIDTSNPKVTEFYEPFIRYDREVYAKILQAGRSRFRRHPAEIIRDRLFEEASHLKAWGVKAFDPRGWMKRRS